MVKERDGSVCEGKIETGRGREFISGPPPFCLPPPFIIPIHSLTVFHSFSTKVVNKDGLATFWPGIGCHSRAEQSFKGISAIFATKRRGGLPKMPPEICIVSCYNSFQSWQRRLFSLRARDQSDFLPLRVIY